MIISQVWKSIPPEQYFKSLIIPESWNTIEEFVDWYMTSRMPLMIPWDAKIIQTDDATAISIFKKPPYQIEMYLIYSNKIVPQHAHPNMEVITMMLGGGKNTTKSITGVSSSWGLISENLKNGETHGGATREFSNGEYAILSFEKWPDNVEITSAAINWKGNTAGPIQEELIKLNNPTAFVKSGYADVSSHNHS
jgi:hypothetical protein